MIVKASLPWHPLAMAPVCSTRRRQPTTPVLTAKVRQLRIAAVLGNGATPTIEELAALLAVPFDAISSDLMALTAALPLAEDDDGRLSLDVDAIRPMDWP